MRSFKQEGRDHGKSTQIPEQVHEMPAAQSAPPTPAASTPRGRKTKDVMAKSVIVIGIVIVLIILGWVGITAVRTLPNGVDAFASAVRSFFTQEKIIVGVNPDTIPSDESRDVAVTWRHADKNSDGFYAFRHDCADGVQVSTEDGTTIFCGSAFRFEHTENALMVNVTASTSVAETAVPFVITFTPNDAREALVTGAAVLTVVNTDLVVSDMSATSTDTVNDDNTDSTDDSTDASVVTTPGTPQIIVVDTTPTSNPNGTPDLAVSLLAIGTVDEDTGTFTERSGAINLNDLESGENVAVRFIVENLGDKTIEEWEFEAKLPTIPSETFKARKKDTGALLPGTQTEFTLGFDRARKGDVSVSINLDHDDDIDESNENNNDLIINLTLTKD